jgi:hypothetical protein
MTRGNMARGKEIREMQFRGNVDWGNVTRGNVFSRENKKRGIGPRANDNTGKP